MKINFKKILSLFMAVLMCCSVLTVATSAAGVYTITLEGGYRQVGSTVRIDSTFNDVIDAITGDTFTDANGVVYTIDRVNKKITFQTDGTGRYTVPDNAFEILGYVQDGWSAKDSTNSGTYKVGTSKTVTADTTLYPKYSSSKTGPFYITLVGGERVINGKRVYGELLDEIKNQPGDKFTLNGIEYTIHRDVNALTFATDGKNYKLVSASNFFKMPGYSIKDTGWSTSKTSSSSVTSNKLDTTYSTTNNNKYFAPDYVQEKYEIKLSPGAFGIGAEEVINDSATYNLLISLADKVYTRDGHIQIGWATTDGATEVECEMNGEFRVEGAVTLYPVWQQLSFDVSYDAKSLMFGSKCVGYSAIGAKTFTITNNSNSAVTFTLPTSEAFEIVASSTTIAGNGGKVTVSVQPKTGLAVASYLDTISFDFGVSDINFSIPAKFVVNNHVFAKYEPVANSATYSKNGKEIAKCHLGCGAEDEREMANSKKVYAVENNTADGLLKEYLYHKTVKFVAFGSGMDDYEGVENKRFRPTEWGVADTKFGGKFAETYTKTYDANDYTVKYDHGDGNFGTYTLTIKYVEEEKAADGSWVATGIEDTKTFKYSIGPSEKDNVEVVRPNMIVSIIFGLFGYLIDLITSGSLF